MSAKTQAVAKFTQTSARSQAPQAGFKQTSANNNNPNDTGVDPGFVRLNPTQAAKAPATPSPTFGTAAASTSQAPSEPPAPGLANLSPAQLEALNSWNNTYGNAISGYNTNIQTELGKQTTGLAANQLGHDQNTDNTNANLGARGLGMSSIRTNDLADLDLALATKNLALRTATNTYITGQNTDIAHENDQNTITQGYYTGLEGQNAAATDQGQSNPGTTSTGTATNTLPAAQSAAQAQASSHPTSAPKPPQTPPVPTGAPKAQPNSSSTPTASITFK